MPLNLLKKLQQKSSADLNTRYIIDGSYLIYYAGISAFNSWKRACDITDNMLHPEYDLTLDEEYTTIFKDTFLYNVRYPIEKVSTFYNLSQVIFALDCPRKKIWRREIFPDYKVHRDEKDHSKDQYNIGKVFSYAKEILLPTICDEYNSIYVNTETAEGDDVIATLTKKLISDDDFTKVVIISSDRDMIQLCSDRVNLYTINGEERSPKIDLEKLTKTKITDDVSKEDFLLFKILLGDSSDGIPNIKRGVGPKKALSLIKDKNALKKLIAEDQTVRDIFIRNKKLISFNEIPTEVSDLILEEYSNKMNNLVV